MILLLKRCDSIGSKLTFFMRLFTFSITSKWQCTSITTLYGRQRIFGSWEHTHTPCDKNHLYMKFDFTEKTITKLQQWRTLWSIWWRWNISKEWMHIHISTIIRLWTLFLFCFIEKWDTPTLSFVFSPPRPIWI